MSYLKKSLFIRENSLLEIAIHTSLLERITDQGIWNKSRKKITSLKSEIEKNFERIKKNNPDLSERHKFFEYRLMLESKAKLLKIAGDLSS